MHLFGAKFKKKIKEGGGLPTPCRRAGLRPFRRKLICRGKMNLKRGGGELLKCTIYIPETILRNLNQVSNCQAWLWQACKCIKSQHMQNLGSHIVHLFHTHSCTQAYTHSFSHRHILNFSWKRIRKRFYSAFEVLLSSHITRFLSFTHSMSLTIYISLSIIWFMLFTHSPIQKKVYEMSLCFSFVFLSVSFFLTVYLSLSFHLDLYWLR